MRISFFPFFFPKGMRKKAIDFKRKKKSIKGICKQEGHEKKGLTPDMLEDLSEGREARVWCEEIEGASGKKEKEKREKEKKTREKIFVDT